MSSGGHETDAIEGHEPTGVPAAADATPVTPKSRRDVMFWICVAGVLAVHFGLVAHFAPTELVFADRVLAGADMPMHFSQALRVSEAIEGWGQTWAYDPTIVVGWPAGTIFDADNKAWALWVHAGHLLGFSRELAFNTFAWASHVWVLPTVFVAARLFGLERGPALLATFGGSMIWLFDSFTHWCWWAGMVAFDIVGYFALIPLALFWRHLRSGGVGWAVACAITLGVGHVIHPYLFPTLVVPMVALYVGSFRSLDRRGHAMVWGIAAVTVAMNLWWLLVAFSFWHFILDSAFYGQAGISFLAGDFFGLLLNFETSGLIGTRAGFRLLIALLGMLGAVRWMRAGDERGRLFVLSLGTLLALTYLGTYVPVIAQIQPFRFVVPTAFFALIPGAALAWHLGGAYRTMSRSARTLVVVLSLPAGQHLVSDALYFLPGAHPVVEKSFNGMQSPLAAHGYYGLPDFRWQRYANDDATVDWLRANVTPGERVLVDLPHFGDQLSTELDAEIIGGFTLRNLEHSWSNFYRRRPQGIAPHEELRRYIQTYAVSWVVASGPAWFNRVPNPNLELAWSGGGYGVYRTTVPVDKVLTGGGTVWAETNRIHVTGSDPDSDVVVRYHWLSTFVCKPDCTIGRAKIDDVDPVGFVGVPAPHPADFVIENGY